MNVQRTLWLVLAGLIILGPTIIDRELMPPDEPRFGLIAQQMHDSGDWVALQRGEKLYTDKPPLLFWSAAAAFLLTGGVSEAAARIGPLLATLLMVALTHRFALRWFGEPIATYATCVFVTCSMILQKGAWLATDPLLALGAFGLVTCLDPRIKEHASRFSRLSVCAGLCAAIGMLAKGPVVFVPLLGAFGASLLVRGPALRWGRLFNLGSMLLLVGVTLPWITALVLRVRLSVLFDALYRQNVERYVASWDNQEAWWYYVEALTTGLFPWSILAAVALAAGGWRRLRDDAGARWMAVWSLLVVVFFSIPGGKRGVYLLPMYPVFASLVAVSIDSVLPTRRARFALVTAGVLAGGLLATLGIGFLFAVPALVERLPEQIGALRSVQVAAGTLLTCLGLGLALGGAGAWTGSARAVFFAPLATTVALGLGFFWLVRPAVNEAQSARAFGAQARQATLNKQVGFCRRKWELISFYSGTRGPWLAGPAQVSEFLERHPRAALICALEDLPARDTWPAGFGIAASGRVGRLEMVVLSAEDPAISN